MDLMKAKSVRVFRKRRKVVGRGVGSGHGKTSTRGSKGQKARAGFSMRRPFEGGQMPIFRRLPKRGFNNKRFKTLYAVINVEELSRFTAGQQVDPAVLEAAGLLQHRVDGVKILGTGELSVALTVRAHGFSASAREKIEKAGGKAELL